MIILFNPFPATVDGRINFYPAGSVTPPPPTGGDITFVAAGNAGAGSGFPILPIGIQDGDVLIYEGSAAGAGWTSFDSTTPFETLFWTRKNGAVTVPTGYGNVAAFRNCAQVGSPFEASGWPTVTTLSSGSMALLLAGAHADDDTTATTSISNPTGPATTLAFNDDVGNGADTADGVACFYGLQQSPGATSAAGITITAVGNLDTSTGQILYALRPVQPQFVSAGTLMNSSLGAPTPSIPAGIVNNDILLCFVPEGAATMPAGWNNAPGFPGTTQLFWKRTTGAESAPTVNSTALFYGAQILAFRGCTTTGSPIEVIGTFAASAGAVLTIPSMTTVSKNSLVLAYVVPDAFADTPGNNSPPATYAGGLASTLLATHDELAHDNGDGTWSAFGLRVLSGLKGAPGATGNETFSTSTNIYNRSYGILFNIKG